MQFSAIFIMASEILQCLIIINIIDFKLLWNYLIHVLLNRVCTAVFIFKGGYSELVFSYSILPLAISLLVVCLNCVLSKYNLIPKSHNYDHM